jgi:predicted transposase YbfD/YdcC
MGQKKGQVPAHIQPKTFSHPGVNTPCIIVLSKIEDPRQPSCNTRHSVISILFVVFIAVLCGGKNWEEIYHIAEGLADWLSFYVDLSSGVPSRWTLERVISLIPSNQLQPLFVQFAVTLQQGSTVAIDGKTLCGTRDWEGSNQLHLLHAWSIEEGVCLGQVAVNEKSNEITAFPELISQLELKGLIVTADALNTQKGAVEAVVKKGADYVFPVKGNHAGLLEDIRYLFESAEAEQFLGIDAAQLETLEKSGGRVENRKYALLSAEGLPGIEEWTNCCCVGRVMRTRSSENRRSEEVCYYITSLDFDIDQFAKSVRGHWGVENGLHWSLDVIFREDNHRYQQRIGAANLSIIRKIALTVLARDRTTKCGRATRQVKALASASYREHLLKNCF